MKLSEPSRLLFETVAVEELKHSLIAHKQNEGEAIEVDGIGWQHLQLKPFKLNGTYTFVFSCHTFSQSTTPT